jgi:3-hydroxy-D-aspartate aldolase
VLLTNQVVTAAKLERLLRLLSESRTLTHLGVLVDSDSGIDKLEEAIAGFGMSEATIPLSVWVEVDAGQGRCGVAPPPQSNEVLRLAQRIVDMATELTSSPASSASPSTTRLRFGGIQCYHGLIQFVHGREARHSAVQAGPVSAAKAARELLEKNGIAVPRVSGGGTGTFLDEASAGAHDEVQPGRSVQLFVSSLSLSLSFLRFSDNFNPCPTPWTLFARHNKLLFSQTNHSRLLIRARPCCCRLVPASPSWTQCTAQP